MGKFYKSAGIGSRIEAEARPATSNHFNPADVSPEVRSKIASMGMERVAGNLLVVKSTKEFWAIRNGKLVRVTTQEVDNGETLQPADSQDPQQFLNNMFSDITF